MNILANVEFDIHGTINKGLTINIDGLDRSYIDMDTYLRNLNTINIKISTTGIINYADDTKSLIILTNPRNLLKPLYVNIYEEIIKYELYSVLTGSTNTDLTSTYFKINKLTLVIDSNSDKSINIDLYSTLIYLKEIIVLINVTYTSTLTFTSIDNHRHNLNIIVYDNA
jgi:hypothetical protein